MINKQIYKCKTKDEAFNDKLIFIIIFPYKYE